MKSQIFDYKTGRQFDALSFNGRATIARGFAERRVERLGRLALLTAFVVTTGWLLGLVWLTITAALAIFA